MILFRIFLLIWRNNSQNNLSLHFKKTSIYSGGLFSAYFNEFTLMTILLWILLTLFIFTLVVFIHEMGHFLTARLTKMKVFEFGIGIPPKAKRLFTDKKWTEYTLNWLPIGWFVRIKWEDPGSEEAEDKDSFASKKWWARSLVLVAWVAMNFLLAFCIFFGLFLSGVSPIAPNFLTQKDYQSYFLPSPENAIKSGFVTHDGLSLSSVTGSIAEKSGIKQDEVLISINGQKIEDIELFKKEVSKNTPLLLTLSNSWILHDITITPENGKIGVALWYENMRINPDYKQSFSFSSAIKSALWETYTLSHLTLDALGKTLYDLIIPATPTDRKEASEMISGPIGMGAWVVSMVDHGLSFSMLFILIAMLSLNLWVLNILPFPALDGGRLVSTSIMSFVWLFTHKKSFLIYLERIVHSAGMLLLIWLSILIAVMDILKIGK